MLVRLRAMATKNRQAGHDDTFGLFYCTASLIHLNRGAELSLSRRIASRSTEAHCWQRSAVVHLSAAASVDGSVCVFSELSQLSFEQVHGAIVKEYHGPHRRLE